MALTKRTILSQIEIVPSGTIQIRLDKQVVDGDEVVARDYHRTAVEPGGSVEAQMDLVDKHLAEMGYPPLDKAGRERIKRIAKIEHTPDVIKAHKKKQAEAMRLPGGPIDRDTAPQSSDAPKRPKARADA